MALQLRRDARKQGLLPGGKYRLVVWQAQLASPSSQAALAHESIACRTEQAPGSGAIKTLGKLCLGQAGVGRLGDVMARHGLVDCHQNRTPARGGELDRFTLRQRNGRDIQVRAELESDRV